METIGPLVGLSTFRLRRALTPTGTAVIVGGESKGNVTGVVIEAAHAARCPRGEDPMPVESTVVEVHAQEPARRQQQ